MRHETGASLKGMPQSRGARIGVIHISAEDDRRAVLTAILAEEKLKREQIVLVLPKENRAFQHPPDFDDLKMLRRKLQAELVFVIPAGSGPADFARQRRFAVFSTTESFVHSFTTGNVNQSGQSTPATPQPNKQGKRGFFGGGARRVTPIAAAGAAGTVAGEAVGRAGPARNTPSQRRNVRPRPASGLTPVGDISNLPTQQPVAQRPPQPVRSMPLPMPPIEDEDENEDTGFLPPSIVEADTIEEHHDQNRNGIHDAELAGAAALGAGLVAADDVLRTPHTGQGAGSGPNIDDFDDDLPPAQGQPMPANLPTTPAAMGTDTASRKIPSIPSRTPIDPNPIVLGAPRSTGKRTKVLPPSATVGIADPPSTPITPPSTTPDRNTGQVAAAGALGTAAGAALTSTSTGKTPAAPRTTTNTGKTPAAPARNAGALTPAGNISAISAGWPPPSPSRSRSPRSARPSNRNGRAILIVALIILTLLVLGGLTVSANPGMLSFVAPPPATITITPASKTVQDTYIMSGVTGNANADNRQVTVRQLTSTKTATDVVTATGHAQIQAQVATGLLTFINGGPSYDLGGGTIINGPNGIAVATNTFITIPAAISGVSFGRISVQAHATNSGTAGNMPDAAINHQTCCRASGDITVTSGPFTGGQDAKNYTFLQPSDITPITNAHQSTLKSDAQNDIKGQVKSNEQLFGDINCDDPKTTEDVLSGDHGVNVTTAHVTVSVACNVEAYDANAVQTIAQNLLKQKVSKDPTLTGYTPAGHIVAQSQPPQVQQDGTITFSVLVRGVWSYQWTDAMKQTLLNKIQGKSKAQAQTILNSYPGVGNATIDISNGGTTLPNDAKLVVNTVQGF